MPFRRAQLRYFVAVAEEGQMTRAAAKLHIAQPALSQSIAGLEAQLGFLLFERRAHGVTLTPAGETFLEKARSVLDAETEARQTGEALARSQKHTLLWGFSGAPPGLHSPGPLKAFAEAHPEIEVRYQELPFPLTPASRWLAEVDLAVCHRPTPDPSVWQRRIAREPRTVLAPGSHRLASCAELTVAEILEETFIGYHPSTDPTWAGFWSLDDHRGGSPRHITIDQASNAQEVLAALAVRNAITTAPASVANAVAGSARGIVMIPLLDATAAEVVLTGREDRRSPTVDTAVDFMLGVDDRLYGAPSTGSRAGTRVAGGPAGVSAAAAMSEHSTRQRDPPASADERSDAGVPV
jgi:DNA-binding transcriptional LysR family regulator